MSHKMVRFWACGFGALLCAACAGSSPEAALEDARVAGGAAAGGEAVASAGATSGGVEDRGGSGDTLEEGVAIYEPTGPPPWKPLSMDKLREAYGALEGPAASYAPSVARIVEAALEDERVYARFVALCDDIGPRLTGSKALEEALEWAQRVLREDKHENVALEPVKAPHWVRGEESLRLLVPYEARLDMLGLGGSVATPRRGLTAEVVVVSDKAALDALEDVKGKIVLFNAAMPAYDPESNATGYGDVVRFRVNGAKWAAERGAVAALVRSVTAHSLDTPHTGGMSYEGARRKIPAAAITAEAAEMFARLQARGETIKVRLSMSAQTLGEVASGNVVGELRGREKPEEVVVIGGHIDSWDVGQGARDNASGVVVSMHALTILRELGLRPRRTIRVVLWTNEENGLAGAKQYAEAHAEELPLHVAGIESDSGGAWARGFNVQFDDKAKEAAALSALMPYRGLFSPLGAPEVVSGYAGADLIPLRAQGVPALGVRHHLGSYFDIHHTHADTVDKLSLAELQQGTATLAAMAWLLAEMPETLR